MRHKFTTPGPGRTKGLRNKKTIIKEAINLDSKGYFEKKVKEDIYAVIDKVFEKAKLGVPWAVDIVIERALGKVPQSLEGNFNIAANLSITDFKQSLSKLK